MSIVKINAITVPPEGGDQLAERFAARAGAVDDQPGFEGFELLRPTDGRNTWLVITRWADEQSFEAWRSGQDFQRAHHGTGDAANSDTTDAADAAKSDGPGDPHPDADSPGGDSPGGDSPGDRNTGGPKHPVGMSAQLWSFEISTGSRPS